MFNPGKLNIHHVAQAVAVWCGNCEGWVKFRYSANPGPPASPTCDHDGALFFSLFPEEWMRNS